MEYDLTGRGVHAVYDSEGFQMISEIADDTSTVLETFLDSDTDTFNSATGLLYDRNKSLKCTAICQEVINNQYMIIRSRNFFETMT